MSRTIDTISKVIGIFITVYIYNRYGTTAVILMFVYGAAWVAYSFSEQLEHWWRHHGKR